MVIVLLRRALALTFRDRQAHELKFSRHDIRELNVEPYTLICKALFLGIFLLDGSIKPRCSEL
jgi:hypothetical protein